MFKEFNKKIQTDANKYKKMTPFELQKVGWKMISTWIVTDILLKVVTGFKLIDTKINIEYLTIIDYIIIGLISLAIVILLMWKNVKKEIYLNITLLLSYIAVGIFLVSGMWQNSSYINYGWKFPLHEYIFPIIPTIGIKLHESLGSSDIINYILVVIFGLIIVAYVVVFLILVVKTIFRRSN